LWIEEQIEGMIINTGESKDGYRGNRDEGEGELRDGTRCRRFCEDGGWQGW
jgi:hypothetical protein